MPGEPNESAEARASFNRARELETRGDKRAAAAAYLMAFTLAPNVDRYRRAAFARLNVMSGYAALPAPLVAALSQAVARGVGDLQPLAMVVRNLMVVEPRLPAMVAGLSHDDPLVAESAVAEAAWLLDDALTLAVMSHATNVSLPLEAALVSVRRHLCLAVTERRHTVLMARHMPFSVALAMQAATNGYLWPETAAESAAVTRLAQRADRDAAIVRAAYRPLTEIDATEAIALPEPLRRSWDEDRDERRRRSQLPQLTPLAAGLSHAMQAQYETYPYPRWRQIEAGEKVSLRAMLAGALPNALAKGFPGAPYDILVAGCGTGHPALSLALSVNDGQVLAIDLSRASLAYAERMAAKLGASNITFAVADILNLDGLARRFDLIDCSGVLHHTAAPSQGLAVLRRLLKDTGVMLVSLYSERGRAAEAAAQALIEQDGTPDTLAGLRQARTTLISLPADAAARAVTESVEFFSRDGLHDLVFNIHESRTTPSAMKRLLEVHGLTPVAVDAPEALGAAEFRRCHPNPADWANLDLWDAFEIQHPQTFAHMIKVWCVPTGGTSASRG